MPLQSVTEAIKSVAMVGVEVVVKILDSGVLAYVPIPGLEAIAQVLVSTWAIVKQVSVSSVASSALWIVTKFIEEQQVALIEAHSALRASAPHYQAGRPRSRRPHPLYLTKGPRCSAPVRQLP
jgi:hypothetical protein